jgi:hypothetical protein
MTHIPRWDAHRYHAGLFVAVVFVLGALLGCVLAAAVLGGAA